MKKLVILFTILIFTLSLLSTVSAEHIFIDYPSSSTDSFYISSANTGLSMCACSTGTDTVQVVNDGSVPIKIDLTSNLDYVSFSASSVNLIPGQVETVYMYVHAPCNKLSDNLEIIATSIYEDSQILERKLLFNSCDNLVVIPGDNLNVSLCTPFQDSFTILNTGSFAENYEVTVRDFNDYSSVAKKIITVPAQKSFEYVVSYIIPCDISGDYNLDYSVAALKNNRFVDFSKDIYISENYDFDIAGPSELNVCDHKKETFNLTLSNQNHFEDEYLVKLVGPSFVDLKLPDAIFGLESNTLILNSSTINEIPLVVDPSGLKHVGEYNISILVSSLTGKVVEELVIPLSVNHCYDFSNLINVPSSEVLVCSDEKKYVDIVLEHAGVSPATVELNITGPDYVTLLTEEISFNGKEGKKAVIMIKNSLDISEVSEVKLNAYFEGELVGSDSFEIVLKNETECYALLATKKNLEVRYDAENVYLNVKNFGIKDGLYEPLTFSLPAYLELTSGPQTINASDDLFLAFDINRDELVNYANTFNNGSIIGLENTFLLNMQRYSGQEFYSKMTVTFVDKPWYEWVAININSWWDSMSLCLKMFVVLSSLAALFLLILIVKLFLGRNFFSAKTLGLVLLILVVVAVISVFAWKGIPIKSTFYTSYDLETNSTIYLKLEEDSSRSFDLNEFFFDPDNNIVNYTVTLENDSLISSKIQGDTLKIKPSKDWNGLTSLELIATDEFGAFASSGDIYVDVLPLEDYSCSGIFSLACHYFNLVMFAIASLFFYLLVSFRRGIKEVRDEKQLTLMETVVIKNARAPRQDVVLTVNKPTTKKNASSKNGISKKKSTKKSAKKSFAKKDTSKQKASGTIKSKVDVSDFKVDNL